jgi:hypothetical protein
MGGSKGGGGSVQTPRETSYLENTMLPNLGWYESQFMSTPYDIGNYYSTIATGGAVHQAAGQGSSRFGVGGNQTQTFAGGAVAGGQGTGSSSALGLIESNPLLAGIWNNIQKEQTTAGTMQGMLDTTNATTKQLGTEVGQLSGAPGQLESAMQGTLLPGQQAEITSQVDSTQTQLKNQLASMGLGSSTQGTELSGEIGLQGAATAGQLMQQNVQNAQQNVSLLNAAQQLSLGSQQLGAQEQNQLFQQLGSVASQFSAFQGQMASESSQAYQMSTTFLNNVLQPLGYALQAGQQTVQADSANLQAQSGGGGGGSPMGGISGLIGGLGSLFGGGGGAAAGAGGGLLGSLGGAIGGIGSGIGSAVGAIAAIFT